MATEVKEKEAQKTKVQLVVNDKEASSFDVTEITSVEIRGATGVATYRLDPLQDAVIKLVVIGRDVPEPVVTTVVNPSPPVEMVVGHLGTPYDVKALKASEDDQAKEQEAADKEAVKAGEAAQKEEKKEVGQAPK